MLALARRHAGGGRSQDGPPAFAAHPLAQLSSAFALGVLADSYLQLSLPRLLAANTFASLLLAILFVCLSKNRSVTTALILVVVALLGATLESVERNRISDAQLKTMFDRGVIVVGEPVEITGVLEREPEVARDRLYLQLRLERITARTPTVAGSSLEHNVSGVVTLLAPVSGSATRQEYDALELHYGARIRVTTLLDRADTFRNPGVSSFTEYLDRKGYDATGFVKSPLLIERLDNERVLLPLALLYEWRRRLQTEIDLRFNAETAGVLDAAFLGNRYNLSNSVAARFREGGTFHVLVISGLHITFLGGLVFLIARRAIRRVWLRAVLSLAVLWAYSLAVGAESSVVRAALMFSVVLIGHIFSRRATSLNALGAAALFLLVNKPADLFDPSFQLTFASVLAMVLCAWPLVEKLSQIGSWRLTRETPYPPTCSPWLRSFSEALFWSEREAKHELERLTYDYRVFKTPTAAALERFHLQRPLRYAFGAVIVSASVQFALLPLLVVYFHRLSVSAIVLNIGVSLLMGVVALVAGLGLIVAQFGDAFALPLIRVAEAMNWLMVHSVDPFARLQLASTRLPEYSGPARLIYVLYYLPLALLLVWLSRWNPIDLRRPKRTTFRIAFVVLAAQLLVFGLVLLHPFSEGRPTGTLRIDFLDVGQGDAALVTFPDNTTLLVDGGGRPGPLQKGASSAANDQDETFERETRSIGEAVVSEYLWWRGLDHIDYLLATHADADHIDGLNDVVRNFKIGTALVARIPEEDEEFRKLSRTLADENVPLRLIGAGDVLRFDEVSATVLWPPPSANVNYASGNNDSIVFRLEFDSRSILLTGDVETAGERGILPAQKELRADVIKVAHHGSKTSSTDAFVAATRPSFAIISVGQTSIFGHPNAEVVKRWADSGARVMTTGRNGTISVITDGRALNVETFVK